MAKINFVLSSGSVPWVINVEKAIQNAQRKEFDGLELILTRRAIQQIRSEKKIEGLHSFHEPFRIKNDVLPFDKMAFLDMNPFEEWNYLQYMGFANRYQIPIVTHINAPFFSELEDISFQEKSNAALEFNTFDVSYDKKFTANDFLSLAEKHQCSICFDVGYAYQAGWNLTESFKIMKSRIKIIHLYDMKKNDPQSSAQKNFGPGEGILPLGEFLQEVKVSNWEGQVTFELLPQPIVSHKKALNFVREKLS